MRTTKNLWNPWKLDLGTESENVQRKNLFPTRKNLSFFAGFLACVGTATRPCPGTAPPCSHKILRIWGRKIYWPIKIHYFNTIDQSKFIILKNWPIKSKHKRIWDLPQFCASSFSLNSSGVFLFLTGFWMLENVRRRFGVRSTRREQIKAAMKEILRRRASKNTLLIDCKAGTGVSWTIVAGKLNAIFGSSWWSVDA